MLRESRVQESPNWDDVCFHAQQCAEKYLKAKLCEADIPFGKVHDLVYLLNAAIFAEPDWKKISDFWRTYPILRSRAVTPAMRQIETWLFKRLNTAGFFVRLPARVSA